MTLPGAETRRAQADNATTQAGVRLWIRKSAISLLLMAMVLFVSRGRWNWAEGWIFLGLFGVLQTILTRLLARRSPDLLAERSRVQAGTKPWDKPLVSLQAILFPLICWIVSGLDLRFEWGSPVTAGIQVDALGIMLLGYALTAWAMLVNRFFSATVRIQTDRDHSVVAVGPYRFVRHPGYAGAILFQLATPLFLGSWWGALPAVLSLPVHVTRAALEDRTLRRELAGYCEYAEAVRFRLLPGIW